MILVVSSAVAERPWPKQVAKASFGEVATSTLPKALRDALLQYDEFSQGTGQLAEAYRVCRIDLDGDGTDEVVVMSPQSYSGGPEMYAFQERSHRFAGIAEFAGSVYFGPRVNGYLQIVSLSRGGGGMLTRSLLRYEHGKYHLVRLADYRQRESDDELDFVRERDPKEYDHAVPDDVVK